MAKANTVIRSAVDTSTGEIVWRTENYSKVNYYDADKGYLLWVNRNGTKCFDDFELPKTLTDKQVAMLYRLSKHLLKNANLIYYRSNNRIKAHDIKSLSKLLGLGERRTKIFITKMVQQGIMARAKVKIGDNEEVQYYINPIYFFNGKYLSVNLYLLFKQDLDHFLPQFILNIFNDKKA